MSKIGKRPLPLHIALQREWRHLIGIVVFVPLFLIFGQWFDQRSITYAVITIPLFISVTIYAMLPYWANRAPRSFFTVGGFISILSGGLGIILFSLIQRILSWLTAHHP